MRGLRWGALALALVVSGAQAASLGLEYGMEGPGLRITAEPFGVATGWRLRVSAPDFAHGVFLVDYLGSVPLGHSGEQHVFFGAGGDLWLGTDGGYLVGGHVSGGLEFGAADTLSVSLEGDLHYLTDGSLRPAFGAALNFRL
ncbi:MAG TPA: hypothetical protein VHN99_01360 [Deinococcales bacterium]|nr:hypothetical protein [Deinococcales bacterium]